MTEKKRESVYWADRERRLGRVYEDASGEHYDELGHLKQQYIDGDLTEEEFEQRLEQLDDLSPAPEPDQREIDDIRQNLIRGFVIGGLLVGGVAALTAITMVSRQLGIFALALIISLTVWVMGQ